MKKTLLFLLILFAFSCSSSENPPEIEDSTDDTTVINPPNNPGQSEETLPSFTAIGYITNDNGLDIIYQFDYESNSRTGSLTNLTEQLDLFLTSSISKTEVIGQTVTFYYPGKVPEGQPGDFVLWQKNVQNNSFFKREGFFDSSNFELPHVYTMRGREGLFVWEDLSPGNIGPNGEFNLMLRILNESNEIEDILIKRTETFGAYVRNPLVIGNFLFIPRVGDESEILVVDLDKKELVDEIKETNGIYMLKNEVDNLIIIGVSKVFTYNPITQNITSREADQIVAPYQVSDNQDVFSNNRVFHRREMAQPSAFPYLPAVYYVDTKEEFVMPISNEQIMLEGDEFAWRPFPTAAVFDVNSDHYLIGARRDYSDKENVMMMVDLAGEIMDIVSIPLQPFKIIIN